MNKKSKIYVAGHQGLVGSSFIRQLTSQGYTNIIIRTFQNLDLRRQSDVEDFFEKEKPEYVFLAAAKVGGIHANNTYKAEFIYENLMIAANVIHASYKYGVKKLLNLGTSCIYPKYAPQPLKEEYLLTGPLESTNEPYAIAKIAAIKLCRYYNEQYETNFISVMPTNLYGPNDNFDLENSHVIPGLIRKFHLAKLLSEDRFAEIKIDLQNLPSSVRPEQSQVCRGGVEGSNRMDLLSNKEITNFLKSQGIDKNCITLWGTGNPYREFLYVDDMTNVCIFLMQNYNASEIGEFINLGTGEDMQIKDLTNLIKKVIGYSGEIKFNSNMPNGTIKKLLDVSRIDSLGWKAKISLENGIRSAYASYSSINKINNSNSEYSQKIKNI